MVVLAKNGEISSRRVWFHVCKALFDTLEEVDVLLAKALVAKRDGKTNRALQRVAKSRRRSKYGGMRRSSWIQLQGQVTVNCQGVDETDASGSAPRSRTRRSLSSAWK